jgi:hypothetical protein
MPQLPEEILYDVRLIERHIRRGVVTREEVDARMQKLQDKADEGDAMDLEQLRDQMTNERAKARPLNKRLN